MVAPSTAKPVISKFQPSEMAPHRIILIVGKRGTGKSVMMSDIISHMKYLDYGVALTPTNTSAETFRSFMPASCVYDECRTDVIGNMMAFQREESAAGRPLRNLYILMDDCMYDRSSLKTKEVRDLFMNGRHQNITFIFCVQYLMDISPDLRAQIDYVIALRDPVISNRIKLWKEFFGVFGRFDEFAPVMQASTEDHKAIILDNVSTSNEISGSVYWYRANPDLPQFYVGRRSFYRMCKQHSMTPEQISQRSGGGASNAAAPGVVLLEEPCARASSRVSRAPPDRRHCDEDDRDCADRRHSRRRSRRRYEEDDEDDA